MDFIRLSFLIPILPFLGATVNGLISFSGIKVPRSLIHTIGCGAILAAFGVAVGVFLQIAGLPSEERSITVVWFEWLSLPILSANVAFLLDPLSVVMILVVTGVGSLIHIYSIGYMRHDPGYARFFAYFNLFCFAMLVLVLADNLLLMFVGWEGVGLCSYLLIGFWFDHKPNAVAGMKAFIVNRIGDFGFLLGVMILVWSMASVDHPTITFAEIKTYAHLLDGKMLGGVSVATAVCLLLFVGASGKSAQLPLYVWLPDAMAGPTPVSALIHAATMVTAGVYLVGRMNFLYVMSTTALAVVAAVGAATAIFAATIGFAQNDIKKVLAYSTVSQLGYMFLGMGTGMFTAGIFHLVTHAFFKACLFLGAGSVILGMHHEQDIQKMGGLKKYMPVTYVTFLIATLAIAGIAPLSGFFSKDEILWQAFSHGAASPTYYILWGVGIAGALATAFYMTRVVALTFWGELKSKHDVAKLEEDVLDTRHKMENRYQPRVPYESPRVITWVLVALAVLSIFGGGLSIPTSLGKFFGIPNLLEEWLAPVWGAGHEEAILAHGSAEYFLMILSVAVALLGIFIAVWLYTKRPDIVRSFCGKVQWLYKLVFNKYYIDEIYDWLIVRRLLWLTRFMRSFDQHVIDGFVNLTATVGVIWSRFIGWWDWTFVDGAVNVISDGTIAAGRRVRKIQTGHIQHYFYIALVGLLALLAWRYVF